ncbi:MAG: hypothetical protein P4M11_04985 [Candidatus Pacebacteria bacterium]|nr:hypothetical protein [Candidatus Paceibacterota bacterium]
MEANNLISTSKNFILYHGNCPDGFGGAYAAWKKFGENAEYIPVSHGKPAPEGLEGGNLYLIDFCYPQDLMDGLVRTAAHLVVLDHHEGIRNVVEKMPEFVFDNNRSGATIAWNYFHPDEPVPAILRYVEDGDLYRFVLPESHSILVYLYAQHRTFQNWDELRKELDAPDGFAHILAIGRTYGEYYEILVEQIVHSAELVSFEGYECYLASCSRAFTSDVGNKLARSKGPLALIASVRDDGLRVSLRGDGTVDVAAIAQKYGGNGHKSAAAFAIPFGTPIPWTPLEHENPGN